MTRVGKILHFGYHRCLTAFFNKVLKKVAAELRVRHENVFSDSARFFHLAAGDGGIVLHGSSFHVCLDSLGDYSGSHIVRDPRDMLVSGYNYHKDAGEEWLHTPLGELESGRASERTLLRDMVHRLRLGDAGLREEALELTYSELLNRVDRETGLLIELNWRYRAFIQMERWDYSNRRVLEMRYENVVGDEVGQFEMLLNHHGIPERIRGDVLKVVEEQSIGKLRERNRVGEGFHARQGEPGYWREHLPATILSEFDARHGGPLGILGYGDPESAPPLPDMIRDRSPEGRTF